MREARLRNIGAANKAPAAIDASNIAAAAAEEEKKEEEVVPVRSEVIDSSSLAKPRADVTASEEEKQSNGNTRFISGVEPKTLE